MTNPLLYSVKTNEYPGDYRYGFYSDGPAHRINGVFFGQTVTSYFNKDYVVVMASNYQKSKAQNEKSLFHIYEKMLHQQPYLFKKAKPSPSLSPQ